MSRSIQILSVPNRGKVGLTVKGEPRKIEFIDKGIVSVAFCDHDEAEKLLGLPNNIPGAKGYWKDTPIELDSSKADDKTGEGNKETDEEMNDRLLLEKEKAETLTAEAYAAMTQVAVLRKALANCTNKELIGALIQSEAGAEKPRDKWLEALSGRLAELG